MAKPAQRRRAVRQENNQQWRTYLIGGGIAFALLALSALLYLNLQEPGLLEDIQQFAGLSRGHDETVSYEGRALPPVGGIHSGQWQNCGIYRESVEDKNAVHSMEHGAVWIAYRPELSRDEVTELESMARGQPYVLLAPYPQLQSPIVLTAWGIQLEIDSVDDDRIAQFIERYQRGPQTPELLATCSDGLGSPIQ